MNKASVLAVVSTIATVAALTVVSVISSGGPPSNTAAPAVSGNAWDSFSVSTTNGSWSNSPSSFTYQWQSSPTGSVWTNIAGATSSSYTVARTDIGNQLRAQVTATNGSGSSNAVSAASSAVVETGNIWVSTTGNDGTCAFSSPRIIDPGGGSDCATLNKAYSLVADGTAATVAVACGTFAAAQTFSGSRTGGVVSYQPASSGCVTFSPGLTTSGPTISIGSSDYITMDGFNLESACGEASTGCTVTGTGGGFNVVRDCQCTSNEPTNDTFTHDNFDVGKELGGGSIIFLSTAQNWTISNDVFGPACCGEIQVNSPVGITIGKPSAGTNDCAHEACNVAMDNNTFQYATMRLSTLWPTSGPWTQPPGQATCTNGILCHLDSIHIYGCITCEMNYNQFLGTTCTGIFVEGAGGNGSDDQNITIIGNVFTQQADHCDGGIAFKTPAGGTNNIGFNSGNDNIQPQITNTNPIAGTIINIYGNYAEKLSLLNASGNSPGVCPYNGTSGNVTVNFQYNQWQSSDVPSCDATDSAAAGPGWKAAGSAPTYPLDMHLVSTTGLGTIPCASLTVGPGCPTGTDVYGTTWPAVTVNRGAQQ